MNWDIPRFGVGEFPSHVVSGNPTGVVCRTKAWVLQLRATVGSPLVDGIVGYSKRTWPPAVLRPNVGSGVLCTAAGFFRRAHPMAYEMR